MSKIRVENKSLRLNKQEVVIKAKVFLLAYLFSHSANKDIGRLISSYFLMWNNKKGGFFMRKNKKIILTAILLAMLIILSRFLSIKTPILKISFSFVPTMLCAIWLGPKWTILLNVLGDLIGATLFPTGPYFVGYTISTAIAGFIYGILLYQKPDKTYSTKEFIIRLIVSTTLVAVIVNMGLNTLWSVITTGKAFFVLLSARIVKQLIMIPIHVVVILFLEKALRKPFDKYVRSEND